ncbi:MAG: hypothetical protein IMZ43_01520 [Thermoplasmata archaeon]|nr:hypothetical protein [Thermoplasmata archaeon]
MTWVSNAFLEKLEPSQKKVALTKVGSIFLMKFLWKRGDHLFIIGNTGSGKTQKAYWLVNWMRHTKETVIWLDSAKNQEMIPLLKMGTPVRIICPKGTSVKFEEFGLTFKEYPKQWELSYSPCWCVARMLEWKRAYLPMENPPEIIEVPDAGSAWWHVKRGYINIFCFRNAFERAEDRGRWMGDLFETLSTWTRKQRMPHIYPFCIFGDEAHWFNAGQKITSNSERNLLSELITEHALEIRAYGGRLVLIAQGYKNLPPATRENLPNNLLCRGAKVSPDENNALSAYNQYTSRYRPEQGLFVYSDGEPYPKKVPWTFPFFPMPKIKIQYIGEFDNPTEQAIITQEIEQEMTPDLNKYTALVQDLQGYEPPHDINRYEAITID